MSEDGNLERRKPANLPHTQLLFYTFLYACSVS